MKYIKSFLVLIILAFGLQLNAQIGYQVSLLNSATGEPRANETVSVQVEITNSENSVICSETKSATTNEFGVLSLQIGSSSTFENVDWSKLPLYVSATVDGIMIGKSQILNVPVAEAAKTLVNVDPSLICRAWRFTDSDPHDGYSMSLSLNQDKTFGYSFMWYSDSISRYCGGGYYLLGNCVYLLPSSGRVYELPTDIIYSNGNLYFSIGSTRYKLH